MAKRYQVAVDIQNLWYSCRYAYGPNYRVDYKKLLDYVADIAEEKDSVVNCTAYMIASPNHDQTNFVNTLRMLGFNIKKRNLHYDSDKRHAQNTNWDVGITADALFHNESYDSFVLVSGDGDFIYLLDPLKDLGKEVVVVSFERSLNKAVSQVADEVFYLCDDVVYDPKEKYKANQSKSADEFVDINR
tara:strand:- start:8085 stop:8648 length:564 start_codon:yes stop_codon:yes gene_type:complete